LILFEFADRLLLLRGGLLLAPLQFAACHSRGFSTDRTSESRGKLPPGPCSLRAPHQGLLRGGITPCFSPFSSQSGETLVAVMSSLVRGQPVSVSPWSGSATLWPVSLWRFIGLGNYAIRRAVIQRPLRLWLYLRRSQAQTNSQRPHGTARRRRRSAPSASAPEFDDPGRFGTTRGRMVRIALSQREQGSMPAPPPASPICIRAGIIAHHEQCLLGQRTI